MLLHEDLLGERHLVGLLLTRLAGHHNLAVTALHTSHGHLTVDFAHDSGVRRVACLEEFGDAGQTTGDITALDGSARNLNQRGTGGDHLTILDLNVSTHGEDIGAERLSVLVLHVAGRHEVTVFGLGDDTLFQAGGLIMVGLIGLAFGHILKFQLTGKLAHDDGIEGVPTGNHIALVHHGVVLIIERASIGHRQCGEHDARIEVDEPHLGQTAHHHLALAGCVGGILYERNRAQLVELDACVVLCHDGGIGGGIGGHTTGVERTEGKLCTRLTDSLSSNHTHGLALLHHAAGGQVATVALHAHALAALASEH